jgi:heme exporter protein D
MQAFLDMGGYAAYVWPAYGAAAVILVGLLVASLASLRRRQRELARLDGGRERRS